MAESVSSQIAKLIYNIVKYCMNAVSFSGTILRYVVLSFAIVLGFSYGQAGDNITLYNYNTFNRDSLSILAENGNLDAMCDLGKIYSCDRTILSQKKAFEFWEKAAKLGHQESCFRTGLCYHFGEGVRQNAVKAMKWFLMSPYDCSEYAKVNILTIKKMSEASDCDAMFVYGKMNVLGLYISQDIEIGLQYLENSKTIESYNLLGDLYQNGDIVSKDWNKAISYYQNAANLGDTDALSFIAYCQWNGHILRQDKNTALSNYLICFQRGMDRDVHRAAGTIPFIIGSLYRDKSAKEFDMMKSISFLETSVDKYDDISSMYALAEIYYNGENGIPQDYHKSFFWLSKAVNSNTGAHNGVYQLISNCYRFGRGVSSNQEKAEFYEKKALEANNVKQDKLRILNLQLDKPKSTTIDIVVVRGGEIAIGATPRHKKHSYDREYPSINITVDDFGIGRYEVTQRQWIDVMGYNNSQIKGEDLPVTNISCQEINLFIQRLNQISGKKYRLPSEAEWEYAARGGQNSNDYYYIGSDEIEDVAWRDYKIHPVGQKKPNELGIYDMAGNVWELCSDYLGGYGKYFDSKLISPKGDVENDIVARRGGSAFYSGDWGCMPSFRGTAGIGEVRNDTGFRLCIDL